ncbi:aldo/keto reductase [Georgenia halophila]|uniref:Aldo/keto reductase n=1 Tax=Georgenia halophila TaxID=620889 RepID=A0ABP8LCR4_9MICO
MTVPTNKLNDGNAIPQLGFGVYLVEPDECERIVGGALEAGYRHIDTAALYENEEGVGRAIAGSGIPRDELFITTKLWNDDQGKESAPVAFERSLEKLGLDYVDLYLIHWPSPTRGRYVETWQALEEIKASGRARSIGVSNFQPHHLEDLFRATETVPAINQVELHPRFTQRENRAFGREHGIAIESWGPLGQGKYPLFDLPEVAAPAEAHGVTPAQVVIRWHLQNGLIVFPKTNSAERARQNLDVFGFELTAAEMAAIDSLDDGTRVGADPDTATF